MNWVVEHIQSLISLVPHERCSVFLDRLLLLLTECFHQVFPFFSIPKSFTFSFRPVVASLLFSSHSTIYISTISRYTNFTKQSQPSVYSKSIPDCSSWRFLEICRHVCVTKYPIRVSTGKDAEKPVNGHKKQKMLSTLPWQREPRFEPLVNKPFIYKEIPKKSNKNTFQCLFK